MGVVEPNDVRVTVRGLAAGETPRLHIEIDLNREPSELARYLLGVFEAAYQTKGNEDS